tara:strand:- start:3709 stop:4632 length:924 start_codon:yes stop_codon:yes gene_type:complete
MNKLPFLYDKDWHIHEIEYNKLYNIHLLKDATIVEDDVIFPALMFEDRNRKKNIIKQGGFLSVTPYFPNREDFNSSSFSKRFKNLIHKIKNEASCENIDEFLIHQFPLQTFRRPFSFCEELGYKTYYRGRSFVDLKDSPIDEIWNHVRKRYRSHIRKFNNVNVFHGSIPDQVFGSMVDKHFKLAGRKTKPDICWDILREFVKNEKACVLKYNNDFLYFFISEKYSYYSISAAERSSLGVTHALMWEAIKHLKSIECELLDVGIYYPLMPSDTINDSEALDFSKIQNISHFKNGFANKTFPDFYSKII